MIISTTNNTSTIMLGLNSENTGKNILETISEKQSVCDDDPEKDTTCSS